VAVRQGLRFLRAELPRVLAMLCNALSPRMVRVLEDLACDWRRLDERPQTTCGRGSDLIIRSTGVSGHLGLAGGRSPPNGEFDDMFSYLGRGDSDMRDERVGAGPAADRSHCRIRRQPVRYGQCRAFFERAGLGRAARSPARGSPEAHPGGRIELRRRWCPVRSTF